MAKLKAVLLRRWPLLALTILLGMVAGVASTRFGPERGVTQFQAEQVVVANRMTGNPASVTQDSLKVTRGAVPVMAAEALDRPDDASTLARKVKVRADKDSNSIRLTVFDPDPKLASAIVQAFTGAFLEEVNTELRSEDYRQLKELQRRVDDAEAELKAFDEENGFLSRPDVILPQTPSVDALIAERKRLVDAVARTQGDYDAAELNTSQREPYSTLGPEKPRIADSQMIEVPESPVFRAGLLGLLGLLLGAGLVALVERVNTRVDTREELAAIVSLPVIAEIGKISARQRPGTADGKVHLDGVWSEHYRRVRSAIQFVQTEPGMRAAESVSVSGSTAPVIAGHYSLTGDVPRIFMFVSALPGEGKSTSVALTALALAEVGHETLVLNADFRRPKVESYLGMPTTPSLADRAKLSADRLSVNEIIQQGNEEHLWLAAAGPPTHEVGGRLSVAREVAAEAAAQGVTVLIDSSPLRVSNDPIDLLSTVDEVVLVVRAGRTTVKSLLDTMELLEMHHAPVLGIVLIGTLATREMYAYYQSYYEELARSHQHLGGDDQNDPGDAGGGEPDAPGPGGDGPGDGSTAVDLPDVSIPDETVAEDPGTLVGAGSSAASVIRSPLSGDAPRPSPTPSTSSDELADHPAPVRPPRSPAKPDQRAPRRSPLDNGPGSVPPPFLPSQG